MSSYMLQICEKIQENAFIFTSWVAVTFDILQIERVNGNTL